MEQQLLQILKQVLREESLSDEDLAFLENWSAKSRENADWLSQVRSGNLPVTDIMFIEENEAKLETLFNEFWKRLAAAPTADLKSVASSLPSATAPPLHRVHFLKTVWFRYAAVLLLIAATATFFYQHNKPQKEIAQKQPATQEILPGGNRARLTLADGSTIVLDSAANGNLANQGNTKILKLDAGSLVYNAGKQMTAGEEVLYNTITTPKGGQYQIVLPDGSKVWLNAASSIRFPTAFVKDRNVAVTGEAYFEITSNAHQPFYVSAALLTVKVLGTRFNINAYNSSQSVNATLLDGSVQVVSGMEKLVLKPGQQALARPSEKLRTSMADITKVMAWKNGLFNFEGVGVQDLMQQVERWYDVQVVYEANIPKVEFVGEMERSIKLSDLIRNLQGLGLRCRLEANRRLVVLP